MKYVPAMVLGLLAVGLSSVAFSFAASYSPLLSYLIAVDGNSHCYCNDISSV